MDSEKDKLVTGSHNGEVIAWNFGVYIIYQYLLISKLFYHSKFQTRDKIHRYPSRMKINHIKIRWPIVITCTRNYEEWGMDQFMQGIQLYNLKEECLIRHINVDFFWNFDVQNKVLVLCQLEEGKWEFEKNL